MRRVMMAEMMVMVAVSLTACGYTPPATLAPQPVRYARAPYDSVWARAVEFVAQEGIPILSIDKYNGLISSSRFELPLTNARQWFDCGRQGNGPVLTQTDDPRAYVMLAQFSVVLRNVQDSTAIRATAVVDGAAHESGRLRCVSTGQFETALFDYVTGRATAARQ